MLPSRERLIEEVGRQDGVRTRRLARSLNVGEEEFPQLVELLLDEQKRGHVVRVPGRGWYLPERSDHRVGIVRMTQRGYAFVNPVRPDPVGDIFIPAGATGTAFDGDLVVAELERVRKEKKRAGVETRGQGRRHLRAGRVVDVVERRKALVRGRFWLGPERKRGSKPPGFVEPLERSGGEEIYIEPRFQAGARDGQKVLVRLLQGHDFADLPRGEIVLCIEDEGTAESDFDVIAAEHGFPVEHSKEAISEAKRFSAEPQAEDLAEREDLRDRVIFTIDPEDAKDFDDAISLERLPSGGFRVGVHIADVSHYARSGSTLDASARERGTSIYLPGRVVPMLPERVANVLASLRPQEDHLTKTVFLDIDSAGVVRRSRVVKSVIRSVRRFTYDEVLAILRWIDAGAGESRPEDLPADAERWRDTLQDMATVRDLLHARRRARGCLELALPSLRLNVDAESGQVLGVLQERGDPSHSLIEELMLAANEAVARFLEQKGLPLIARTHDAPDEDSLAEFYDFLEKIEGRHGRSSKGGDLQRVLEGVADAPFAPVVSMALLRSLPHAEYKHELGQHFALATAAYCHFTSPIRRYPDLVVHQVIDEHLSGALGSAGRKREWRERMPEIAASSSATERRAEEAERDMTKLRLIRYLQSRVGEEMVAMITGVHPFGFFVQEAEQLLDGLVHVGSLDDDFYEYDEEHYCLRGTRRGHEFHFADRVRVLLAEVNPDFREIRFRYLGRATDQAALVASGKGETTGMQGGDLVSVYTDGGCRGNPGLGAWAAVVLRNGQREELSGVEARTTNNRMELMAAIAALESLATPSRVEVVTDSNYVRKGITEWMSDWIRRGWRTASRKPVQNRDLWERLKAAVERHEVAWEWVPGHSGHPENERCDTLVNEAMDAHGAGG